MTTYIYETIPTTPGVEPRRFEVMQRMTDAPLTIHPDTGEPVRRVITGGYGLMGVSEKSGASSSAMPAGGSCCGSSCGCG